VGVAICHAEDAVDSTAPLAFDDHKVWLFAAVVSWTRAATVYGDAWEIVADMFVVEEAIKLTAGRPFIILVGVVE